MAPNTTNKIKETNKLRKKPLDASFFPLSLCMPANIMGTKNSKKHTFATMKPKHNPATDTAEPKIIENQKESNQKTFNFALLSFFDISSPMDNLLIHEIMDL
jgi:hypothetical protein